MLRCRARLLVRNTRRISCLRNFTSTGTFRNEAKEPLNPLAKHLRDSIKLTGPMTTAHYMRQVLTNPLSGFYMHSDVFGTQGDFITSPEISQMFGELAGIWYLTEWMRLGKPSKTQFIELGPGRGTLMSDMLRALSRFPYFYETIQGVHLVEASPALRRIQRAVLSGKDTNTVSGTEGNEEQTNHIQLQDGIPVYWHDGIELVPGEYSFIMAHEFFDALPIHSFQKTEEGWRELLIDIDEEEQYQHNFRLVCSPSPTVASKAYMDENEQFASKAVGERVEISPDSWNVAGQLAEIVNSHGGAGLIIDYGQDYAQGDTLRAIRKHQIVHPMSDPGSADLSADVDFFALKEAMKRYPDVVTHGPVTQSQFLQSLGIRARLEALLKHAKTTETRMNILKGCERLINPEMMGRIYKVLAFSKEKNPSAAPVGFGPV